MQHQCGASFSHATLLLCKCIAERQQHHVNYYSCYMFLLGPNFLSLRPVCYGVRIEIFRSNLFCLKLLKEKYKELGDIFITTS